MLSIGLPPRQIHVSKPPRPEHLIPMAPKTAWDGWFAIAIFDKDSPIRWLKAHLFHRDCKQGWHPVASFEGMDQHSEMLITYATENSVAIHQSEVDTKDIIASANPLSVSLSDRFSFKGESPKYRMQFTLADKNIAADFSFTCSFPIWWSRWGRLLSYCGQHGKVKAELMEEGRAQELAGLGVMEHVAGMALPKDITTFFPGGFHWDVLRFNDGIEESASAAGLSLLLGNKSRFAIRAAIKIPGQNPECTKGLFVKYLELDTKEIEGKTIGVPLRWEGRMKSRRGVFRYEAKAATPAAALIPGGGMMGFDFEGEWKPKVGSIQILSGVGFNEYGDFNGSLGC